MLRHQQIGVAPVDVSGEFTGALVAPTETTTTTTSATAATSKPPRNNNMVRIEWSFRGICAGQDIAVADVLVIWTMPQGASNQRVVTPQRAAHT